MQYIRYLDFKILSNCVSFSHQFISRINGQIICISMFHCNVNQLLIYAVQIYTSLCNKRKKIDNESLEHGG